MIKIKSLEFFFLNEDKKLERVPNTKKIEFHDSLNFIAGTDNSVGKSSLLEVINFCLGSNARINHNKEIPPQVFCSSEETQHFYMALTIFHNETQQSTVIRSPEKKDHIYVDSNSFIFIENKTLFYESDIENYQAISIKNYNKVLGELFFGLHENNSHLSFRSLIEWFLRVAGHPWDSIYKHLKDVNYNLAIRVLYLLGFNDIIQYQKTDPRIIKEASNIITEVINDEAINNKSINSTIKELKNKLNTLQENLKQLEQKSKEFEEERAKEDIWREYNNTKKERSALYNEKRPLEQERADLKSQLNIENQDLSSDIKYLLEEAGIIFQKQLENYLQSVVRFHNSVLNDRRIDIEKRIDELSSKINNLWDQINDYNIIYNELENKIKNLDSTSLLDEVDAHKSEIKSKIVRISTHLETLEKAKNKLSEREKLNQQQEEWISNNKSRLDHLIQEYDQWVSTVYSGDYDKHSLQLYKDGTFNFHLNSGSGQGESEASKVLFDLWLLKHNYQIGFLIHDSNMFNGISNPHLSELFQIIIDNIGSYQYIFSITEKDEELLSNTLEQKLNDCKIITLTKDKPLFGFRFES